MFIKEVGFVFGRKELVLRSFLFLVNDATALSLLNCPFSIPIAILLVSEHEIQLDSFVT